MKDIPTVYVVTKHTLRNESVVDVFMEKKTAEEYAKKRESPSNNFWFEIRGYRVK